MRYVFLLLIVPCFLAAQQPNENWSTPVADVEFGEKRIYYSYSYPTGASYVKVKPEFYDKEILYVRSYYSYFGPPDEDFKSLISQLNDYITEWEIGRANNRDKHIFLESCAIMVIWNIWETEILKPNILKKLTILKNDLSVEISRNANMVLELYNYYNGT